VGGQELFFEGLSRALVRRGHRVDVYCIGHVAGLPMEEVVDGVRVIRFPSSPHYTTPWRPWMKRRWDAIFRYALKTRAATAGGAYDACILNQWPLLHAALLSRAARRVSLLHWCEIRQGRFYRILQRWLPRRTALNAAISQTVASDIERQSGRPCMVLPSGLDLARYRAAPAVERRDLLFLGRIAPHKNIPLLIEAFEILRRRGSPDRLIIAGDGTAMDAVRQRVANSPESAAIELTGHVTEPEKLELLARASVLVMPSLREGFPRALAEAMASGLPVVTPDFPENGTRDVVSDAGCGVVTATDAESLAEGILAAKANWARFSAAGIARARTLSWEDIATVCETALGAAVAKAKAL
jgi:glycosyltransferase involved in cell wall biosynthesis